MISVMPPAASRLTTLVISSATSAAWASALFSNRPTSQASTGTPAGVEAFT
jgi:hypothetical protein